MKKILFLFALVLLSHLSVFSQLSFSKWQTDELAIDGNASDWLTKPRFFNSESKIQYKFRNDAQNLYLVFQTTDRATQMQFQLAGFSLRFKVKTDSPLKCSITFPPHKMEGMKPDEFQQQDNNKLIVKSEMKPRINLKDSAILEGFLLSKGVVLSDNITKSTICFARNKEVRGQFCFEVQLPLKELFGENYSLDKIKNTPIQLYVNVNALSGNDMNRSSRNRRMGGHGGGGHSGGMPGGGMPSGGAPGGEMGNGHIQGGDERMPAREFGSASMSKKSFDTEFQLSVK